jgi:hypothetical protein
LILLPTSYFGPVSYYVLLSRSPAVRIELYEHFVKQTWRNRCSIYSPNGVQHLTVPLDGRRDKTLTRDIRISYARSWQVLHWRSLEAAYRSSPYFEYYEEDLRSLFEKKFETLVDLNTASQQVMMELIGIKTALSFTEKYETKPAGLTDLRDTLSKGRVEGQSLPRYMQVFENKFGYISNLSILDLFFNLGPNTNSYLAQAGSRL